MPKLRAWRLDFDRKAPRVWNPELAKRRAQYPQTPEAYEAMRALSRATALETHSRGTFTRKGVPDGWGGRKAEAMEARRIAGQDAALLYRALRNHNGGPALDEDEGLPETDAERADFVMAEVFGMFRDPTSLVRDRLNAARLLLSYVVPILERGKQADMRAKDVLTALSTKLGLPPTPPLTKRV